MQDYNTIIGSIQMRLNGCQTRSVMDRYKIGSGTLNLIMSRYHANGIPIEELRMMAPKEVEYLFYPQKNLQRKDVPLPDFQYYYDRIHAPGSRMNISFCWLDYKEKNPDGYEKSQFYEYFNRFIAENYGGQKVSMAVNRIPGEKMYIDWVGDQPELLTDTETGEIKKVHIFATTIGVSSLIYAEAFPNEKLPCFIEGCAHAVSFYGAVAKYFVPDNLKTAVTKHTKDELILQSTFADLEDFYETIVLPPPARKPKGKPTVENHVRYLETHLVEKLKEKIYVSFEDLNDDIKKIVAVLNKRPFQGKDFSRLDAFGRRMLPPNNESISKISKEEGISEQTLRNWRDKARADGITAPGKDALPDDWSTQDKFLIVVETASMNETELAEYARKKGLYVEQIKAWRDACMNANGGVAKEAARLNRELKESEKERKKLEKELARKEKALAETAALLVLRKKADAIWGDPEDE